MKKNLFINIFVVRFIYSIFTWTYAAPDEFWQGPEIAHSLVFGNGYQTWEWSSQHALRSYLHPTFIGFFAYGPIFGLTHVINAANIHSLWMSQNILLPALWLTPRLLAAVSASICDIATYSLALKLFGNDTAIFTLIVQMSSTLLIFSSGRSFSNGLEATLTTCALFYWRLTIDRICMGSAEREKANINSTTHFTSSAISSALIAGILGGISFAIRPTSAIIWFFLGLLAFPQIGLVPFLSIAFSSAIPGACVAVAFSLFLDRFFYGFFTFPALNFLLFNFISGLDKLYGEYPKLWFAYNGIPTALGFFLPIVLFSIFCTLKRKQTSTLREYELIIAAFGVVLVLSIGSSHKEHRFLFPVLPIINIYVGKCLMSLTPDFFTKSTQIRFTTIIAAIHIAIGMYLNVFHQRGPVEVTKVIGFDAAFAHFAKGNRTDSEIMQVHFLMPCHSTPYYSIIHYPVELVQLDCSPETRVGSLRGNFRSQICESSSCCHETDLPLISESDAWAKNPLALLRAMYGDVSNTTKSLSQPMICENEHQREEHPQTLQKLDFATYPMGFAKEFGSKTCQSKLESIVDNKFLQRSRLLPSHIVLFDTDAEDYDVSLWLHVNNYSLSESFHHSYVKGDVHAINRRGKDPVEVRLYKHVCWNLWKKSQAIHSALVSPPEIILGR